MSAIAPKDYEARAIATLVELCLLDPDPRNPDFDESVLAAAREALPWVRRAKLGTYTPEGDQAPKRTRKVTRPKGDSPELKQSKAEVRRRSGGYCEILHVGCTGFAQHAHHRRMRSQGGSDGPGNLLDLCTVGHLFVHANPELSYERGWLLHAEPVAR